MSNYLGCSMAQSWFCSFSKAGLTQHTCILAEIMHSSMIRPFASVISEVMHCRKSPCIHFVSLNAASFHINAMRHNSMCIGVGCNVSICCAHANQHLIRPGCVHVPGSSETHQRKLWRCSAAYKFWNDCECGTFGTFHCNGPVGANLQGNIACFMSQNFREAHGSLLSMSHSQQCLKHQACHEGAAMEVRALQNTKCGIVRCLPLCASKLSYWS